MLQTDSFSSKQYLLQAAQILMKEAEWIGTWNKTLHQKYENIDAKATQIFLSAESKCTPKFPTLRKWSIALREVGLQMRYYNTYRWVWNPRVSAKEEPSSMVVVFILLFSSLRASSRQVKMSGF